MHILPLNDVSILSGKSIVKPVGEVICIRKFYLPGIPIM